MAAEIPLLLRNRLPALLGWKSSYFGLIWHLLKAIVCVTFSLCCKQTHFHTHPTVLKNQHCEANVVFSWNKISKPRQFQPTDAGYDSCGGKWIHWGLLACFFPLLCFSKRWINFGGEYKAEEHHWTHTCTFPVCAVISESRAVQTAQSTLSFSLCPFVSYYTGKRALSRDWREARPQWGRKEAAESHAVSSLGWRTWWCWQGSIHRVLAVCEIGCEEEGLTPELQYSILTCHMAQHFLINRGYLSLGTECATLNNQKEKNQQSRTYYAL